MKPLLAISGLILTLGTQAQLVVQSGATFFIDAGAVVTVQGDVTSNANITGTGKLEMKGSALQNLNMNGFEIPNLKIDNASHVALGGAAKVTGLLEFTNGRLQLGAHNFTLGTAGTHSGAAAGKFAETNGAGLFRKEVTAAGTYVLPVGNGANYSPLSYQLTGGAYASAVVAARSVGAGHPSKHPRSTDFLNNYWALSNSGITGATIAATGTYVDPTGLTGVEADIRGMVWNGTAWTRTGATNDGALNTVTAPVTTATNDLYAMNTFVLVSPTVMLQGPYDAAVDRMRDRLRHSTGAYVPGNAGLNNILPNTDPYRTAPYNQAGWFAHTANAVTEQVTAAAVFNDQQDGDHNIVDWVFLELRNPNSGTNAPIVQTRSALLRRNGLIVDIDGTSPVYFKNIDANVDNSYAVAVRHRNHLGISTSPASPLTLGLSTTNFDFSNTATVGIYGTPNTNFLVFDGKNQMWAGNTRHNGSSNWSGLNNDKDYLYTTVLGSNAGASVAGYSAGDLNLNRTANWSGLNNDKDYLYITVLGSNSGNTRTQLLPTNL